jgi:hypothetical protein
MPANGRWDLTRRFKGYYMRLVPMKPIESEGVEAIDAPLYATCPQRILYWNHCTYMALTSLYDQNVWLLAFCLEATTHETHTVKVAGCMGDLILSQFMDSSS